MSIDARTLVLAGLRPQITEGQVRRFLAAAGAVTEGVVIPRAANGAGMRFAFVVLTSPSEAERVRAQLDGRPLTGRPVRVERARPGWR